MKGPKAGSCNTSVRRMRETMASVSNEIISGHFSSLMVNRGNDGLRTNNWKVGGGASHILFREVLKLRQCESQEGVFLLP